MNKTFQQEILERRNTIFLKSINPKHTLKPKPQTTTTTQENNLDYLLIMPDIKNNNNKQIPIDLNGNTNTNTNINNSIKSKHLIYMGVFIVVSYIGITAINDYIILKYFRN